MWKKWTFASLALVIAGGLYFSLVRTAPPVAKDALTTEFAMESVSVNGIEYKPENLKTLSIPKSAHLKFAFRFKWLTNKAPRETASIKIIKAVNGKQVIVQSATGSVVNKGKTTAMSMELRIPDDVAVGDAVISLRNMGTPFAEIPCKIIEKP